MLDKLCKAIKQMDILSEEGIQTMFQQEANRIIHQENASQIKNAVLMN